MITGIKKPVRISVPAFLVGAGKEKTLFFYIKNNSAAIQYRASASGRDSF